MNGKIKAFVIAIEIVVIGAFVSMVIWPETWQAFEIWRNSKFQDTSVEEIRMSGIAGAAVALIITIIDGVHSFKNRSSNKVK